MLIADKGTKLVVADISNMRKCPTYITLMVMEKTLKECFYILFCYPSKHKQTQEVRNQWLKDIFGNQNKILKKEPNKNSLKQHPERRKAFFRAYFRREKADI